MSGGDGKGDDDPFPNGITEQLSEIAGEVAPDPADEGFLTGLPGLTPPHHPAAGRAASRTPPPLVVRDDRIILSESYFYKTEAYYRALDIEIQSRGSVTMPATVDALESYIVPLCLERARRAGVATAGWEISYAYLPVPAVVYQLNYYADPSEHIVVRDESQVEETVKKVTHSGKFPFCFQPLPDGHEVVRLVSVMGRVANGPGELAGTAMELFRLFGLPVAGMTFTGRDGEWRLSSIGPVRYPKLTASQRSLLAAAQAGEDLG